MTVNRTAEIDPHLDENSYGYNVLCYLGEEYVGRFFRVRRDDAEDMKALYEKGEMSPKSD